MSKEPELVIRIAKPDDVHEIMNIATMACEENGFLKPNPVKLLNDIWAALNLHKDRKSTRLNSSH